MNHKPRIQPVGEPTILLPYVAYWEWAEIPEGEEI
jgi:hypothetical protein